MSQKWAPVDFQKGWVMITNPHVYKHKKTPTNHDKVVLAVNNMQYIYEAVLS